MAAFEIIASPLVRTYSLEEFWELPDPPDGSKLELIAGVLYVSAPPAHPHHLIVSRLIRLLHLHQHDRELRGSLYIPRAAIWVEANTHIEPDFFYVSEESERRMPSGRFTSADIVVEVLSPTNWTYELYTKAGTYPALGVSELWLVDPEARTIEFRHKLVGGKYTCTATYSDGETLASSVFPALQLPVSVIFED